MNTKLWLAVLGSCAISLAGCGGGGGGAGNGLRGDVAGTGGSDPMAPFDPNTPSGGHTNLTTLSSATSVPIESFATQTGATLTPQVAVSNAPSVRVSIPELGVDDTFTASELASTSMAAGVQFNTYSHAVGATKTGLVYEVPGTDGFDLRYSSLGVWDIGDLTGHNITQSVAMSFGSRTAGNDIPTSGSANYVGFMVGNALEGAGQNYSAQGLATATANFGARSVSLSTSGTLLTNRETHAVTDGAGYNLTGSLSYAAGANGLSGTVSTANGKTGPAAGTFYGPQAAELGVTFKATNGGGIKPFVGAAGLKR